MASSKSFQSFSVEGNDMGQNQMQSLFVSAGVGQGPPVMKAQINDSKGKLSRENALNDGTKMQLSMGPSENDVFSSEFSMFGMTGGDQRGESGSISATAVNTKSQSFFTEGAPASYNPGSPISGTEAIGAIAGEAGMDFQGPEGGGGDTMIWINPGMTRAAMVEFICMHTSGGEGSCMMKAVGMDGSLKMVDANKQIQQPPKATFCHNANASSASAQPFAVRQAAAGSSSGMSNSWMNYGFKSVIPKWDGEDETIDTVSAPSSGAGLPINSSGGGSGGSRYEYCRHLPVSDNVHPNYDKALYENMRLGAMFSETMQVLIEGKAGLDVFDPCEFLQDDMVGGQYQNNPKNSGVYIVKTATIFMKNGRYYERYILMRNSSGESGSTGLK